jgi:hypothetical protein
MKIIQGINAQELQSAIEMQGHATICIIAIIIAAFLAAVLVEIRYKNK